MSDEIDSLLYASARASIDAGDIVGGLALLEQSLAHHVHFKTLELIGELRCRIGQHREAIIPLAAATGLEGGKVRRAER